MNKKNHEAMMNAKSDAEKIEITENEPARLKSKVREHSDDELNKAVGGTNLPVNPIDDDDIIPFSDYKDYVTVKYGKDNVQKYMEACGRHCG